MSAPSAPTSYFKILMTLNVLYTFGPRLLRIYCSVLCMPMTPERRFLESSPGPPDQRTTNDHCDLRLRLNGFLHHSLVLGLTTACQIGGVPSYSFSLALTTGGVVRGL